jgi:phage terminase large subunit-like protein
LTCPARQYAEDVTAGRVIACKWVKLACKRHLADLADAHARGLVWDQDAADHALGFFAFLRHSKGRWNDEPFVLQPWQAFIVASLFGWKRADGTRRFRIAFVEVPRKNGKTTLAAGIGLYLLVADGEAGAEVYCAATKRDQAKLVFEDAKAMVARSPELAAIVERYRYSLQIPDARSKMEPLGADANTTDGLNPFAAICDEIHAWKSRDLWDVLLTGMGAREQPLALAITTAGDFSDSIYNVLHNDCEQLLEGVWDAGQSDHIFAYVATTDSDDDWRSPVAWAKANPNLGVSLKESDLAETIRQAERIPSEQNKVKRLRLNIRTAALNSWLRLDQWDKGSAGFDPADLDGKPCFGGLDMASTSDLASLVLAFPWEQVRGTGTTGSSAGSGVRGTRTGRAAEKLRRRLHPWAEAGHVEFTAGNQIDFARIEETAADGGARGSTSGQSLTTRSTARGRPAGWRAAGLNMLRFPQGAAHFNEPSRYFEAAVTQAAGSCTTGIRSSGGWPRTRSLKRTAPGKSTRAGKTPARRSTASLRR